MCPYELLINMTNWDGEQRYALYGKFFISSSLDFYRLHVESHSGTAGRLPNILSKTLRNEVRDINYTSHLFILPVSEDSLLYHHNKQFSTYDKDNDDNWGEVNANCAETYGGGWYD